MNKLYSNLKSLEVISNSKRTPKLINDIRSTLQQTLSYDYEISPSDAITLSSKNIEEDLGQVKTPTWVAELISNLCIKKPNIRILDPCFGDGVFLLSAHNRIKDFEPIHDPDLWGVEIDPIRFVEGLQNIEKISKENMINNKSFFCGNIFDFEKKDFDCIILNPPYTRQENLPKEKSFLINKEIIRDKIKKRCGITLSLRSNLYVYFIVYLTSLLSNDGRMGVILPKGWLDSKHGAEFQKFLLQNFEIEFIIDFAKDTFEEVIVEDCILILKKISDIHSKVRFVHVHDKLESKTIEEILNGEKSFENKKVSVSVIEKNKLFNDQKWGKYLHLTPNILKSLQGKNLVPLSELADVSRGIETNWNDFFILDDEKINNYKISKKFLTKIISSPKRLGMLNTKSHVDFDYFLNIHTPIKSEDRYTGIGKYIEEYSKKIFEKDEKSILQKKAQLNPNSWYLTKSFKSSPIIFSYIIRKSKFFFRNSEKYLVRDNFYDIIPKQGNPEVLFSLLNSSLSGLHLELIGRRYGNGMLKIQAYELQGMSVPNIQKMPESIKKILSELGKELTTYSISDSNASKIIEKIDDIISKFCELKISSKEIKKIERKMVESRLSRKR